MKYGLMIGAATFALIAGMALAQTSSETTTTTTTAAPPMVAPPVVTPPAPGTLSTTETQKAVDSNGNEYDSTKTTYGNANGAASNSVTTTTVQPQVPTTVITKKTTTITPSD